MAAGKINLQANDGKVLGLYAPDGMSANTDIVPASVNGDATKAFKVADAINADEAVSKAQLDLKATLAEAQAYDLGVGQTWQNVTASRSAGVTYTNTTGKPIYLSMWNGGGGTQGVMRIYIDGVAVASDSNTSTNSNNGGGISTIIPNGSTYKMSWVNGVAIFELR